MNNELARQVKDWMYEAGELIKERLASPLLVEEKTNKADLVTNVDKETEAFFVAKIREHYPADQILGEEGLGDQITDFSGRIWVIDPIDGTLNFVKQQENFCTMLAVYEDGVGQLGFIYEVMKDELIWGGRGLGVFLNETPLQMGADLKPADGLISVNTQMFLKNTFHTQELALQTLGVRMIGCAGIGFKELLKGNQSAYMSHLQPWDYAPGKVLADELGFITVDLAQENSLDLTQKVYVLSATPAMFAAFQEL